MPFHAIVQCWTLIPPFGRLISSCFCEHVCVHTWVCMSMCLCVCDNDKCSHRHAGSPPRMKPLAVDQYNKYKLGVDRLDQRMAYYQFVRKSVRWWRKFFFWMVEVVVVNSYIMYTQHTDTQRKLTHKEFRRELVMALCEQQRASRVPQPPRQQDQTLERLRGSHFAQTGPARRDCRVQRTGSRRSVAPYDNILFHMLRQTPPVHWRVFSHISYRHPYIITSYRPYPPITIIPISL